MNTSMESISGETPEIGTADEGLKAHWEVYNDWGVCMWVSAALLFEVLERNLAQIYTFVDIQIQIFS